jgi:hypothetical protein
MNHSSILQKDVRIEKKILRSEQTLIKRTLWFKRVKNLIQNN